MKPEQAIQIIKEAIHIAISKGCYGLVETTNIVKALEVLDNQPNIKFGAIEEVAKEQPAAKN
jgi:hypothetical protein